MNPTLLSAEQRAAVFEHELSWLKSDTVRQFAVHCLDSLPAHFFIAPASSSGKYHPAYANTPGGLALHTRAAMWIAKKMLDAKVAAFYPDGVLSQDWQFNDAVLLALLLHDGFKYGVAGRDVSEYDHTFFEHPLFAASFVQQQARSWFALAQADEQAIAYRASRAIACHSGVFTRSHHASIVLPSVAPQGWLEKVVHLCDLIASDRSVYYLFVDDSVSPKGVLH